MKLNSRYNAETEGLEENRLWSHFQGFFFQILRTAPLIDESRLQYHSDAFCYKLDKEDLEFYQQQYIRFGDDIIVENTEYKEIINRQIVKIISTREKDILDFILKIPQRKLVILAKVGWGKTTLLKYFLFYLANRSDKISSRIIPVYISLFKESNITLDIEEQKIGETFRKTILNFKIKKAVDEVMDISNDEFWEFIESFPEYIDYKRNKRNILELYKNPEDQILKVKQIRSNLQNNNERLPYFATKFLQVFKKKIPIIVIDDADSLESKINYQIMKEVHSISEKYNIKTIFSFRPSTYNAIFKYSNKFAQTINPAKIELKVPQLDLYLKSRQLLIEEKIIQSKGKSFLYAKKNVSTKKAYEFFNEMVKLLQRGDHIDFITSISCGDIRRLGRMIRIYLSTGHIRDKQLFRRYIDGEYGGEFLPDWLLLYSIITYNYNLYFSANRDQIFSQHFVLNLFSNGNNTLGSNICKIHILSYINKHEEIHFDGMTDRYLSLHPKRIRKEIRESYNNAIQTLINFRLINSEDHFAINNLKQIEEIDMLTIEPAGIYYIEKFIIKYEYLLFMKDDVDLDEYHSKRIIDKKRTKNFKQDFNSVVLFINFIYQNELDFISHIPNKKLYSYRANFAYDKDILFYSLALCNEMLEFASTKSDLDLDNIRELKAKIQVSNNKYLKKLVL